MVKLPLKIPVSVLANFIYSGYIANVVVTFIRLVGGRRRVRCGGGISCSIG